MMSNATTNNHPVQPPRDAMRPWQLALKRVGDVVGALVGMVVFSPAFIYAYATVRKRGGGDVLFRQTRIGYGGRPFVIYKFRTMQQPEPDDEPRLTTDDDHSIPAWGRSLRKRHLDELPQLLNVLRGDMSLVGPRPERKFFIDKIAARDSRYKYIYLMRPGLTSAATVRNGYCDTVDKMLVRLQMDLDYLQTRTLRGDLIIIMQTLVPFLRGKKF